MATTTLVGRKNIQKFVERSWVTIKKWIREENFPARKIDGVWESDSDLITRWRRLQITAGKDRMSEEE